MLLTLATGTGKTVVAFQICWKLWNLRWIGLERKRLGLLLLRSLLFILNAGVWVVARVCEFRPP